MIPGYEAMSYYYNNPEGNALEFADKLAEDVVPMYYGIKEGSIPLAALDAMTLHMGGTALKKANKAKKPVLPENCWRNNMNLREWLEDKIRENSWENRLNEESPYEANAISIAKPF